MWRCEQKSHRYDLGIQEISNVGFSCLLLLYRVFQNPEIRISGNVRIHLPSSYKVNKRMLVAWLRHCAASRKVAGSIPDEDIGFFFQVTLSFQSHYGPGIDSASNRNEYQESSWGGGT
jgi:hypothetical protein